MKIERWKREMKWMEEREKREREKERERRGETTHTHTHTDVNTTTTTTLTTLRKNLSHISLKKNVGYFFWFLLHVHGVLKFC